MSLRRRGPRSVHSNCVGCGSEPRNGERRGSRGGRKRRRQHVRTRYARGVVRPGSRATSGTKGSRRNLGDLVSPAIAAGGPGPRQEAQKAKLPGKRRGVGRPHSTCEAPNKAGCAGGGGSGGKAGRSRGVDGSNRRPGHSTGPTSPMRCHHRCRNWMGRPSPERRCRRLSTRAGCGKDARPDPCGGRGATRVPTATGSDGNTLILRPSFGVGHIE